MLCSCPARASTLVAYFTHQGNNTDAISSASVQRRGDKFPPQIIDGVHKGNTQIIAEYIAEATGGELYAIRVADGFKYPFDPYATLEKARQELYRNSRPELSGDVINIEGFDVIFIGFPVWWGALPVAVCAFLEAHDFRGKIIIPFCTHDGSGLGRCVRNIRALCPEAEVLKGLAVRYSDVMKARPRVKSWIDGLKY